jgi:NADH:quinone reductase (non-electrogenic)
MTEQNTHVVVIGGGYAGVLAANHLRQAPGVDITLVNPRPKFVERIRLHQLVAGTDDATEDFDGLLAEGVRLMLDGAARIDAADRTVELRSGDTLRYDYLIYAVGSTGSVPAGVPGAAEFAYPLSELEQAQRLHARLQDVAPAAPVVIAGGGLTGIETASELAEQGHPVTLVTSALAPSVGGAARRSLARQLARLGVTVLEGATVAAVTADAVTLADGNRLPSTVTVWTTGFGVPGLAAASGLTTDALGRLLTDETLSSVDDERIIGAGDAVSPSGIPLRMSCQSALPLGAQAANTVLSRIEGSAPAEISQAFTGQCISVGRQLGTVQLSHFDDAPRRLYIGGHAAAFVKEQVCKATLSFLRREARKPGSYRWLKSSWRDDALADQSARVVPVR